MALYTPVIPGTVRASDRRKLMAIKKEPWGSFFTAIPAGLRCILLTELGCPYRLAGTRPGEHATAQVVHIFKALLLHKHAGLG